MVQTSLSPLRVLDVAPYNQFTVTCTARAELNGETIPLEITIEWRRNFIPLSSTDPIYMTTGSPESGYQSILSTTETDSMNFIYSCLARLAVDSLIRAQDNIHLQVHGVCSYTYWMKQYFIPLFLILSFLLFCRTKTAYGPNGSHSNKCSGRQCPHPMDSALHSLHSRDLCSGVWHQSGQSGHDQ